MATQNMYNNYIKRSKQNSQNQFRQKVANSLGGKPVGNNTTKKPMNTLGTATPSTYGAKPINTPNIIASPEVKQLTTPLTPSTINSEPAQTPVQPINQPVVLHLLQSILSLFKLLYNQLINLWYKTLYNRIQRLWRALLQLLILEWLVYKR